MSDLKPTYDELCDIVLMADTAVRNGAIETPYFSVDTRVGENATSTPARDLAALAARLQAAAGEPNASEPTTAATVATACADLCVQIREERKLTGRDGMVAELICARLRTFARTLTDDETPAVKPKAWAWAYVGRDGTEQYRTPTVVTKREVAGAHTNRDQFREFALIPVDPSFISE